jgi:phosphatidylserine decarboxylase
MNSDLFDPSADLPLKRISAADQAGGLLMAALLTAVVGLLVWRRRSGKDWLALSIAALAGVGGLIWLYRNPQRVAPAGSDLIVAPCDGRVTGITTVHEARFLHSAAIRIDIATAPSQVQVNWAPASGAIAYRRYELGGQLGSATSDDSSWLGIEREDGQRLLLRQVAARFWRRVPQHMARRIICWPDLADYVSEGEVIGHLPLGGTVQIYAPITTALRVQPGHKVRGCETILALLAARSKAS